MKSLPTVERILMSVIRGNQDNNIRFTDLQRLLDSLHFSCRIRGDHFIYYKDGVQELINIQPDGNKAKAYQVKQIRNLILEYHLEVKE